MHGPPSQLNVMLAHAGRGRWAETFARRMAPLPIGLIWSRDADEAVGLAADRRIHLAVIDDGFPQSGGIVLMRRIRSSGYSHPALLVSVDPDRRLMRDAIDLDVFSVVKVMDERDCLTPVVMRVVRRFFQVDWPDPDVVN